MGAIEGLAVIALNPATNYHHRPGRSVLGRGQEWSCLMSTKTPIEEK